MNVKACVVGIVEVTFSLTVEVGACVFNVNIVDVSYLAVSSDLRSLLHSPVSQALGGVDVTNVVVVSEIFSTSVRRFSSSSTGTVLNVFDRFNPISISGTSSVIMDDIATVVIGDVETTVVGVVVVDVSDSAVVVLCDAVVVVIRDVVLVGNIVVVVGDVVVIVGETVVVVVGETVVVVVVGETVVVGIVGETIVVVVVGDFVVVV